MSPLPDLQDGDLTIHPRRRYSTLVLATEPLPYPHGVLTSHESMGGQSNATSCDAAIRDTEGSVMALDRP